MRAGQRSGVLIRWGGGPAGEELEGLVDRRAGLGGVVDHPLARVAGKFEHVPVDGELTDARVAEVLGAVVVELHVVRAQRTRKSSLRVDSSPMRSERRLSSGSRPAWARRIATVSSAMRSHST